MVRDAIIKIDVDGQRETLHDLKSAGLMKSPKNIAAGRAFSAERDGATAGRKSNVAVAGSMLSLSAAATRPDAEGPRCRRDGGGALSLVIAHESHRRQVQFASFVRFPRLIRSHRTTTSCRYKTIRCVEQAGDVFPYSGYQTR